MNINFPEPEWRANLRQCRLCHSTNHPLIFIGEEGTARPLFHDEGNLKSKILFIVEAPNYTDTFDPLKGKLTIGPYTDPSGQLFYKRLFDLQLKTENVLVTNSVLCLPARVRGKYPVRALQRKFCSPNLRILIENVNPKIVVSQGTEALAALNLIERHGLVLKEAVAKPHTWFGRILFPLYHPGGLALVTRSDEKQREDYMKLRTLLEDVSH